MAKRTFYLKIPLLYALLGGFVSYRIVRSLYVVPPFGIAFFLIIGVCALGVGIWSCFYVKKRILAAVPPELEFFSTGIENFPAADRAGFEQLTHAFEALGFVQLMDYTTSEDLQKAGVARLLTHSAHQCVTEINQPIYKGQAHPLGCMIQTTFDQEVTLVTTNRELNGISYAMRRPQAFALIMPGAAPATLLEAHLKKTQEISQKLGIGIYNDLSAEAYLALLHNSHDERRQLLARKNPLLYLVEVDLYNLKPKREWIGVAPKTVSP